MASGHRSNRRWGTWRALSNMIIMPATIHSPRARFGWSDPSFVVLFTNVPNVVARAKPGPIATGKFDSIPTANVITPHVRVVLVTPTSTETPPAWSRAGTAGTIYKFARNLSERVNRTDVKVRGRCKIHRCFCAVDADHAQLCYHCVEVPYYMYCTGDALDGCNAHREARAAISIRTVELRAPIWKYRSRNWCSPLFFVE